MQIFAKQIGYRLILHFFSKIISDRVFKTQRHAVIKRSKKVIALFPGNLAQIGEVPKSKLCVLLVASTFLTLTRFADVIGNGSV